MNTNDRIKALCERFTFLRAAIDPEARFLDAVARDNPLIGTTSTSVFFSDANGDVNAAAKLLNTSARTLLDRVGKLGLRDRILELYPTRARRRAAMRRTSGSSGSAERSEA